jgi:hypothetical protein
MIIPATPAPAPRKFGIANDVMVFSQELTEAVMSAFFGT